MSVEAAGSWSKNGFCLKPEAVSHSLIPMPQVNGFFSLSARPQAAFNRSLPRLYPASVPGGIMTSPLPSRNNRGLLLFRDYRRTDGNGTVSLMPAGWEGATGYPYKTGGISGPYLVAPDSEAIPGNLLCLEYGFDESRIWNGAQIPVSVKEGADLSGITALSFFIKNSPGTETSAQNIRLFLQIGSIGEDLDGDGTLDRELSPLSDGFDFNDPAHDAVLKIGSMPGGTGNGSLDSEDTNGNGSLDSEISDLVITREITLPASGNSGTVTLTLNPAESARLARVRGIRFIVVSEAGDANGRIFLSSPEFEGSTFTAEALPSGNISVHESAESYTAGAGIEQLQSRFPSAVPSGSEKDENHVLSVSWDSVPAAGETVVKGFTETAVFKDYREYLLYYSLDGERETPAELRFSFLDGYGKGINASFTPPAGAGWHEIRILPLEKLLYLDGKIFESETSIDDDAGALTLLSLCVKGYSSGRLLLDSLTAASPVITLRSSSSFALRYTLPGTLVSVAGIPLLSDFSFSSSFAALFAPEAPTPLTASGDFTASVSIPLTRLGASLGAERTESGMMYREGYDIDFSGPGALPSVGEHFMYRGDGRTATFLRKTTLAVVTAAAELNAANEVERAESSTVSRWKLSTGFPGKSFSLSDSIDFEKTSRNSNVFEGTFLDALKRSYALFIPESSETDTRTLSLQTEFSLEPVPVGLRFSPSAASSVFDDGGRKQKSSGLFSCELPFRFGTRDFPWNFLIGYERSVSLTKLTDNPDFTRDFLSLISTLASVDFLYLSTPFVELFESGTDGRFRKRTNAFSSAVYTPKAYLDFKRPLDSGFINFLILQAFRLSFPGKLSVYRIQRRAA